MNRPKSAIIVGLLLVLQHVAVAQLELTEAQCLSQFGTPTVADSSNGVRILAFALPGGGVVRTHLIEGVVHLVAYGQEGLSTSAVDELLKLNAGEGSSAWALFRHTDLPGEEAQDVWIRSDEGAMAVHESNTLVINTGYWNSWRAPGTDQPSAAAQTAAVQGALHEAANPMAPLVGHWQSKSRHGLAGFTCDTNGVLLWVAMTDSEQREFRARAVSLGPEKPLRFEIWRLARDREPLGLAVLESNDTLRFKRRKGPESEPTGFWPIDREPESTYARVDVMPEWKVTGPDTLPRLGASRADVVESCGKPRGAMTAGGEEILSYPWGQVIFEEGRVSRVKVKAKVTPH